MAVVFRRWRDVTSGLDWLVVGGIVLVTAMLATLSVLRYTAYNASMFDLGHMAQAVWSSTRGRPLEFSYRGEVVSRLSLHSELVYFLLTPLYALFPSPITLLLVQAVLFGVGGFPLYYLAKRRTGSFYAARLVTLVYLLYPTAQSAVLYDFHGDTLAMPLLLFAFDAFDRQAWRTYGIWLLLAMSCKVYIAAPVCLLGAFLWLKGRRRVGMLTCLVGLAWGAAVLLIVRPLFVAPDTVMQQSSAIGYAQFYFGDLIDTLSNTWLFRLMSGLVVFSPVIPIVMYAPEWAWLAFAVALPVLLSSGPGPSYAPFHHRYAVVASFQMLAIVMAAERLGTATHASGYLIEIRKRTVTWRVALVATVLMTLVVNMALVNTPLRPTFWSKGVDSGWAPWIYGRTPRDALKDLWLIRNVPEEVPILASMMLAPHLADRQELHIAIPTDETPPPPLNAMLDTVSYVVLDGLFDHFEVRTGGCVVCDWTTLAAALDRPDFGLISAQDGLLLLQRRPEDVTDAEWGGLTLLQSVAVESANGSVPTLAVFDDAIGLVEMSVNPVGGGRYRFEYVWSALKGINGESLFAVTQLAGAGAARILHVPTIAKYPTTAWAPGDLITESFEVVLPDDIGPGEYALMVGWYDSNHAYAYATDERSRIGDCVGGGVLEVVDASQ